MKLKLLVLLLGFIYLTCALPQGRNDNNRNDGDHNRWGRPDKGKENEERVDSNDGQKYKWSTSSNSWTRVDNSGNNLQVNANVNANANWQQQWKNKGSSKRQWSAGSLNEDRYDTDTNQWYEYDGHNWVVTKGDHLNWNNGNNGDRKQDTQNGRWYRWDGSRWVYDSSTSVSSNSNKNAGNWQTKWKNNWGSKKQWGNSAQVNEERFDTDTNQWYVYDGHSWTVTNGDHFNWENGQNGERRQDKQNGKWYRWDGSRWIIDSSNSAVIGSNSVFPSNGGILSNLNSGPGTWLSQLKTKGGSKRQWSAGTLYEDRYDSDTNQWYEYDGHNWVVSKGDRFNWASGQNGDRKQDTQNGRWYRWDGSRWIYDSNSSSNSNSNSFSSGSWQSQLKNKWGSKRQWGNNAQVNDERYDSETSQWYVFDGHSWTVTSGDHFNWANGKNGERKQDTQNGKWYRWDGSQWVYDSTNSASSSSSSNSGSGSWQNQWKSKGSSKRQWSNGQVNEDRFDTDTNQWYTFDGHNWVKSTGDRFTWSNGRDGDKKQDNNGKLYRWDSSNGGRWVSADINSNINLG